MKKTKKLLCLFLAMVILIPNIAIFSNAVEAEQQAEVSEPLLIEVTTDKSSYTAYGIAGITVKVTNTSDEAINNISAEAVFEQLAPVGKDNETFKEVGSLQPNESFEFSYKATVNSSKVKINFFAKIFLWFTRLFNGGYTATSHDIEADIENVTEIKFGKYTVQNVVRVGYDENQLENNKEEINSELNKIKDLNSGELPEIIYSEYNNIDWIDGNYYNGEVKNETDVINSLNSIKELMGINNADIGWECCYSENSSDYNFYRLRQYYKGYEVCDSSWIVSVDVPVYKISYAHGSVVPANYFDLSITISSEEAKNVAKEIFGTDAKINDKTELVLMKPSNDSLIYNLTYKIYINGKKATEIYYVSAKTGEVVNVNSIITYDRVSANGLDNKNKKRNFYVEKVSDNLYFLADFEKNISIYDAVNKNISWDLNPENDTLNVYWHNVWYQPGSWFKESEVVQNNTNKWNNKDAVTLMANLSDVYDYYYENIGITGYDNNNGEVFAIINDNNEGDWDNAYSVATPGLNTTIISFGFDNEINLDTVAHEYTHSVMNSIIELNSRGEAGALKEAYADIMGELIENDSTWTHRKRVISNPTINGYPSFYNGSYWGDTNSDYDRGYIHQNSTVISHAAYLMSKNGIDNYTLANIWYKSIKELKNENSNFSDCRKAVISAAKKYGCSKETIDIIKYCFYSVGVVTDNEFWGLVEASGKALANVTVTAESDNYKVTEKTDINGRFAFKLPAGTYEINCSLDNYISYPTTITVDENTATQSPYVFFMKKDISSGGDTGVENASVHGTVKDKELGNAISGVRVEFIDNSTDNYDTVATATTGADGSFSVELPYGSYSMSFNHDDYECYGESIEVDTEIVALTEPVLLTPKNSSGDDSGETDEPVITVVNSGDCGADGSNVTWTLYSDGTLVISGNGAMADYDDYDYNYNPITPFSYERLRIKKVIISDGITKVGMNAFAECYNITDLHIGKNVLTIGDKAFCDCESLTNITIPDSVTTIGALAFAECDNVTNLHIGNSVTTIGDRAFDFCENITSVTIPDSVTTIGDNAFRYCYNLANITIPDSVTTIGASAFDTTLFYNTESNWEKDVLYIDNHLIDAKETLSGEYIIEKGTITISPYAFGGCENLTIVTIPDSVITIGDGAFRYCKNLTSVTIPDNVTTIGNSAFEMCSNITNLYIGKNVTTIGREAFRLCGGITSVTIPDNVTTIGDYAFEYCSNITNLYIGKNVTAIGNGAFNGCQALTSVKIPDSVTTIGDSAFESCFGIKDFHIGKGVTTIGDYRPFIGSFNLINITVDENNNYFCSDECGVLFNKAKTLLIQYPCANTVKSYIIPDTVTTIGNNAFYCCEDLTSVIIPNSVITIGNLAFESCYDLTDLYIGKGVASIGYNAFYRCESLTNVTIPDSVITIGNGAFGDCYALTDLYIGNSVTTIGEDAFNNCHNLTSVSIPNSVITIGDGAFFLCRNLKELSLGNSVETIGGAAFCYCENLTDVTIPDSVITIGNSAFCYCENLTTVTIPDSVTSIGDWAFSDCYNVTNLYIGDCVTSIGKNAFGLCKNLTSIRIPDSVTSIGSDAFSLCENLTDVYYAGTQSQWANISIANYNTELNNATIHYNSKI